MNAQIAFDYIIGFVIIFLLLLILRGQRKTEKTLSEGESLEIINEATEEEIETLSLPVFTCIKEENGRVIIAKVFAHCPECAAKSFKNYSYLCANDSVTVKDSDGNVSIFVAVLDEIGQIILVNNERLNSANGSNINGKTSDKDSDRSQRAGQLSY